jgi:putative FmdB family regulatory protein
MPIYEYCCSENHTFDMRRPFSEFHSRAVCPVCAGESSRRLSVVNHTFGFRLTEKSHSRWNKDEYERDL